MGIYLRSPFITLGTGFLVGLLFWQCSKYLTKANDLNDNDINEDSLINSYALQPVNCCNSENSLKINLLIISTLDGHLTALNTENQGDIAWSLETDTQPLFSSTLGNLQFAAGDHNYRLIPSLDGNFYMYNDAIAQGIPISADTLLSSSMKFGSDVISGGKEIRTFGVNIKTGKVNYFYTLNKRENYADLSSEQQNSNLIVKRTTQLIRAVEATTGAERWNVTVGEHELLMTNPLDNNNKCYCENDDDPDHDLEGQKVKFVDDIGFRVNPADGVIVAYQKTYPYNVLWQQKFNSPIAQIWSVNDNDIKELSLFDPNVVPFLPLPGKPGKEHNKKDMVIYIGTYDNEKYVIPSPEEKEKLKFIVAKHNYFPNEAGRLYLAANSFDLDVKNSLSLKETKNNNQNQPRKEGCFENCPTCSSDEVNSLILQDQYPKDMGWYLFKHNDKNAQKRLTQLSKSLMKKKREMFTDIFWQWWNLIPLLVMPIAFATVLWFGLKRLSKFDISTNCDYSSPVTLVHSDSQVSEADLGLLPKSVEKTVSEYESWYLNHFEPLRFLGKGGFGVVIESLNKLDQQVYAVKRISVSNKPDGKERVQREVRALAKLDHPGIVRYYNSWLEEPPSDWQENWDQVFAAKCTCHSMISSVNSTNDETAGLVSSPIKPYSDSSLTEFIDKKLLINNQSIDNFTNQSIDKLMNHQKSINSFTDKHSICVKNRTFDSSTNPDSTFNSYSDSESSKNFINNHIQFESGSKFMNNKKDDSLEIVFENDNSKSISKKIISHVTSKITSNKRTNKNKKAVQKIDKELQTTNSESDKEILSSHNSHSHNCKGRCYLFIQMQLCQDTTLSDWLAGHVTESDRDRGMILDWFDQIVSAVQYVHDCGLIHRDLKPSNIFFAQNGHLRIGDFGLAKGYAIENSGPMKIGGGDSSTNLIARSTSHTDNVGTWLYMSPEQEKGDSYTFKVDIYALGLIFVELILPFSTEMERRCVLTSLKSSKFPKNFENDFDEECNLVKTLISHDPDQRPTCNKIRENRLFSSFWPVRPLVTSSADNHVILRSSRESQNSTNSQSDFIIS